MSTASAESTPSTSPRDASVLLAPTSIEATSNPSTASAAAASAIALTSDAVYSLSEALADSLATESGT